MLIASDTDFSVCITPKVHIEILDSRCGRQHGCGKITCRNTEFCIPSKSESKPDEGKMLVPNYSNAHGITRGAAYYSRSGKAAKNGKDGEGK